MNSTIKDLVLSNNNVEDLAEQLNFGLPYNGIKLKVKSLLDGWNGLGKFDKHPTYKTRYIRQGKVIEHVYPMKFNNLLEMREYYNQEFLKSFSNQFKPKQAPIKELPIDKQSEQENAWTVPKSVVNPNGMRAQQTVNMTWQYKPIAFWQKAPFKRLQEFEVQPYDMERENLFMRFENTGKKVSNQDLRIQTNTVLEPSDYRQKDGMHFSLK